jgi:hypothetical protein
MMIQHKSMALNSMSYKVDEMNRESESVTDPVVKAAFVTVAAEYKRRYELASQEVLHMIQNSLLPLAGPTGPTGPTGADSSATGSTGADSSVTGPEQS